MIIRGATAEPGAFLAAPAVLGTALGKAARRHYDIEARLDAAESGHIGLADLLASVPASGLILVIGAGGAGKGMLWLDPMLVNAVIEVETAAPKSAVSKETRSPTLIDAALCGDFIRFLLDEFLKTGVKDAVSLNLTKLDVLRHETDPPQLALELEPQTYSWVGGNIRFQDNTRGGLFRLALPQSAWAGTHAAGAKNGTLAAWRSELQKNVLAAPYQMRAVIEVLQLTLGQVLAFHPGDILPVSAAALSDLKLVSPDGKTVLEGRLGQIRTKKAVSVTGSPLFLMPDAVVDAQTPPLPQLQRPQKELPTTP